MAVDRLQVGVALAFVAEDQDGWLVGEPSAVPDVHPLAALHARASGRVLVRSIGSSRRYSSRVRIEQRELLPAR